MTASQLRENVDCILDQVLDTGIPVEIEHKGRLVRIVPITSPSRLDCLQPHPGYVLGDPEELVQLDWSAEWKP